MYVSYHLVAWTRGSWSLFKHFIALMCLDPFLANAKIPKKKKLQKFYNFWLLTFHCPMYASGRRHLTDKKTEVMLTHHTVMNATQQQQREMPKKQQTERNIISRFVFSGHPRLQIVVVPNFMCELFHFSSPLVVLFFLVYYDVRSFSGRSWLRLVCV